jgi:hypothetical protein
MKRLIYILALAFAVCAQATMPDEWRLQQLVPRPDPARGKTFNIQHSTFNAQALVIGSTNTPFGQGILMAPFKQTDPFWQNFKVWLEPVNTNGWELLWCTNGRTWDLLIKVSPGDAGVTVRVKANPILWKARVQ